jgi:hypothetical protein
MRAPSLAEAIKGNLKRKILPFSDKAQKSSPRWD